MRFMLPVWLLVCAAGVFFAALPAEAGLVARTGEKISLGEDQVVSGDFYVAGDTLSLSGVIEGDVYAAGRSVVINGSVTEDAVVTGATVQVHGPVGDDLRAFAGEVTIAEHVAGDVVVFANSLTILSTATIDGEVLFFGNKLEISGDVGGSVTGKTGSARIDGAIGGNIELHAQERLTLGDRAQISGNVTYTSIAELVRAQNSVVEGDITRQSGAEQNVREINVIPFLMLLFTSLVFLLLFRDQLSTFVGMVTKRPAFFGLVGLATLIATPVVAILLVVSILGMPLGITLAFLYLALLVWSWSLVGIVLGAFLSFAFTKKYSISLTWTVLGVLVFVALGYIPVFGPLLTLLLPCVTLGACAVIIYNRIR